MHPMNIFKHKYKNNLFIQKLTLFSLFKTEFKFLF
jgi:hypothetical protein